MPSRISRLVWFSTEFAAAYWANALRFPHHAFESYRRSIMPESARILNERFNIGGRGLKIRDPNSLAGHRILIVTGDHDPRHPRAVDEATAAEPRRRRFCGCPTAASTATAT